MTSSVGESEILSSAEIEARKRRERILQLKRKAQHKSEDPGEECKEPRTEESPFKVSTVHENDSDTNDDESESLIPDPKNTDKTEDEELDLSKLGSRKVDWDLKRGIEKSLAILQDRTNEVIAEIVQESAGSDMEDID